MPVFHEDRNQIDRWNHTDNLNNTYIQCDTNVIVLTIEAELRINGYCEKVDLVKIPCVVDFLIREHAASRKTSLLQLFGGIQQKNWLVFSF